MLLSELITRAYIFSGVVARGLDSVSAQQGADGLFLFNLLIGELWVQPDYIPYYSLITLNTVPGQESYFFENVVSVETVTFTLQDVRYSLGVDNRRHYFGAPRAENISSLPFRVYSERVLGGTQVYLYFFPSQVMELNLKCKSYLNSFTPDLLDTDMSTLFDVSYQSYLLYLLVKKICQWNKITMNPEIQKELTRFQQIMEDMNPNDFTIHKTATLAKGQSLTYGVVNFAKSGWVPAS